MPFDSNAPPTLEAESKSDVVSSHPKRSWKQFSLSTFFVIVALVAVLFAWIAYARNYSRHLGTLIAIVEASGGEVRYGGRDSVIARARDVPTTNPWLGSVLGENYLDRPSAVMIGSSKTIDTKVIDAVNQMDSLNEIIVISESNHDPFFSGLNMSLPISTVGVLGPAITDRGLVALSKFSNLKGLYLEGSQVTAEGIRCLEKLRKLEELTISSSLVDDSIVPSIKKITTLKILDLVWTDLSQAGVDEIRQALPNCTVRYARNKLLRSGPPRKRPGFKN